MTDNELKNLNTGDIIRHLSSGDSLVVTGNNGDTATAVRTCEITNPIEWQLISKHHLNDKKETHSGEGWIKRARLN